MVTTNEDLYYSFIYTMTMTIKIITVISMFPLTILDSGAEQVNTQAYYCKKIKRETILITQ